MNRGEGAHSLRRVRPFEALDEGCKGAAQKESKKAGSQLRSGRGDKS